MTNSGRISLNIASLVFAGITLASCGNHVTTGTDDMTQNNIVAGPGEQSFSQKYDPELTLPLPEGEFIRLLNDNGLNYSIDGLSGTDKIIHPPRLSNNVDMNKIQKMYQIYGRIDRENRVGEIYRAYVDKNKRVIYIENSYTYTGP